jgi:hypothetical protein
VPRATVGAKGSHRAEGRRRRRGPHDAERGAPGGDSCETQVLRGEEQADGKEGIRFLLWERIRGIKVISYDANALKSLVPLKINGSLTVVA